MKPGGGMGDPFLDAVGEFMDVVDARFQAMRDEIAEIRAIVPDSVQGAQPPQPGPAGERGEPGERGEAGPAGPVGAAGPTGERGADSTVPGPAGERGQDGRDINELSIRDGDLWARFSDGTEAKVGRVVGHPGERGADGLEGREGPTGRDGAPSTVPGPVGPQGERGADGIATREEVVALVEERFSDTQTRTLADSWREVWREGETYERGDMAQWDGSPWLAMARTQAKPGTSPDWKLFTKKGRDGRDARK